MTAELNVIAATHRAVPSAVGIFHCSFFDRAHVKFLELSCGVSEQAIREHLWRRVPLPGASATAFHFKHAISSKANLGFVGQQDRRSACFSRADRIAFDKILLNRCDAPERFARASYLDLTLYRQNLCGDARCGVRHQDWSTYRNKCDQAEYPTHAVLPQVWSKILAFRSRGLKRCTENSLSVQRRFSKRLPRNRLRSSHAIDRVAHRTDAGLKR
jgi:hypothetical protein